MLKAGLGLRKSIKFLIAGECLISLKEMRQSPAIKNFIDFLKPSTAFNAYFAKIIFINYIL